MNGQNNGTRNFPTPEPNSPKNQVDFRKIVAIAMLATAIAIVLLFCATIIAQIAYTVSSGNPDEEKTPVSSKTDIEYETVTKPTSEIKKGILQLATSERPASLSSEEIENLEKLYSTPSRKDASVEYYTTAGTPISERLSLETAENFGALAKALYEETGSNNVTVKYAYFEPKSTTDSCDFPHALGTTIDICLKISEEEYRPLSYKPEILTWINENCYRFGFVNSDPTGEVHDKGAKVPTTQLRYVGIPHATYIMQNNLSFEDYIERLKNYHTPNNPLIITGADKIVYAVYYVAVDGTNPIKVPKNFEYTISGNNDGGMIITVDKSKMK
ncbi:MAG: hypothetical protein J5894_04130 [Clostridia bacterium]|nr:hypothetical protein [Clostridia bacterium]